MPTYVYETIPAKKGGKATRYEIKQSIKDSALTKHPETGEPIKRVIAGAVGVLTGAASGGGGGHCHSGGCGCRH